MAQDFWASSGFSDLHRGPEGLAPTGAWLARFLDREELKPPPDAGPLEVALHGRLCADPLSAVDADELAAALGKKSSGGHWNSGIAILRNNGLIETDGRRYRTAVLFRE